GGHARRTRRRGALSSLRPLTRTDGWPPARGLRAKRHRHAAARRTQGRDGSQRACHRQRRRAVSNSVRWCPGGALGCGLCHPLPRARRVISKLEAPDRSEEHTSELQSQSNLVCRLLLEKKKKKKKKEKI